MRNDRPRIKGSKEWVVKIELPLKSRDAYILRRLSFVVTVVFGLGIFAVSAQSAQWQQDAGGKMAFDVASVKPNNSNDQANAVFPLGPGDAFAPSGGLFWATNQPLIAYVRFAYKLGQSDLPGLPNWAYSERFDIEARKQGNATKDQFRLMLQSLLADRFKLAMHTATKQGAVFGLVLQKRGRTGPQLRHSDSCSTAGSPGTSQKPAATPSSSLFSQLSSIPCNSIGQLPDNRPGLGMIGGKAVTIARIAGFLTNPYTGVDRPVLDRTRFTGTFDFVLEWSVSDPSETTAAQPDTPGPSFLEALQERLGLKLQSSTGPVQFLVVDHVEHPSEN
jgi:uncharacterized protein (TIGR03435 family)